MSTSSQTAGMPVSPAARWATVPSAMWRVLMIVGLMPGTADLRRRAARPPHDARRAEGRSNGVDADARHR